MKEQIKIFVKYVRDFSIVVAGIAVTLYINYIVTNQGEKRDMYLYLNTIKMELEQNIIELDTAISYYRQDVKYADYLRSHDKKELDDDSIRSYAPYFHSAKSYTFNVSAFEMFKFSGTMRLIQDKELMLSIWDVYSGFSSLEEQFEWVMKAKWEDLQKELFLIVENNLKMTGVPMYNFYYSGLPYSALQPCENMIIDAKKLLEKLEVQLRIKN